jgi:uncharacterized membrane protein YdbT with pleckstrin-like domain
VVSPPDRRILALSGPSSRLARVQLIEGEQLIWKGKPSWRSTMSFYVTWAAIGIVPLIAILLVNGLADTDWPVWIGVIVLVVVLGAAIVIGWVRRYFTQYTITTKRITIRQGFLSKTEHTAHIDRVQNVTIHQTVFDRIFRVGRVDFDTAGADSDANLVFYGVDDPQDLRERIAAERLKPDSQGGIA